MNQIYSQHSHFWKYHILYQFLSMWIFLFIVYLKPSFLPLDGIELGLLYFVYLYIVIKGFWPLGIFYTDTDILIPKCNKKMIQKKLANDYGYASGLITEEDFEKIPFSEISNIKWKKETSHRLKEKCTLSFKQSNLKPISYTFYDNYDKDHFLSKIDL